MPATNSLSIRRFSKNDLSPLCNLISETIEKCYTEIYPPKAVRFFIAYHAPENILRDAAVGIVLVGWRGGTPVATATLVNNYVCRVFVHPQCQGQGFGKEMSDAIERLAIDKSIDKLELDASLTSRRFWERLGWRVTTNELEIVDDEPLEYYKMMKILVNSKSV